MRNVAIFFLCITFLQSCRDDFSLEAPYENIPVVYAYLDASENEHFIRVQKAFLGQNGNGELSATVIDSLYYGENEAEVTITQNGEEVSLERVNGDDFGISRPEGDFANTPNILYRLPRTLLDLRPELTATIAVKRPGEEDAVAQTLLLGPMSIAQPSTTINIFNYNQNQNWRWDVTPGTRVFDARLYINIREFFLSDPSMNRDVQLEWILSEQLIPDEDETRVVLTFNNERFWQFLNSNLAVNDDVRRSLDDMVLVVTGVGSEIEEELELAAANAGITSAQALPTYTNVENGLGVFTSRTQATLRDIVLDARNNDTLRNGVYTRDLNFQ
ncbi:MAG: hypothetical protein AAF828_07020 [Bacteroidota bacterium]